jgi:hypothetical protein
VRNEDVPSGSADDAACWCAPRPEPLLQDAEEEEEGVEKEEEGDCWATLNADLLELAPEVHHIRRGFVV